MTFIPPHDIEISRSLSLTERPILAAHLAANLSLWTEMEMVLAQSLGMILGIEAETMMIIYTAITNDGSKQAAFKAAAQHKLDDVGVATLNSIFSDIRERAKIRIKIAHGIWGISPEYSDAIFYTNPEIYLRWQSQIHTLNLKGRTLEALELARRWPNALGYKEEDLTGQMRKPIMELIGAIENFKHYVSNLLSKTQSP